MLVELRDVSGDAELVRNLIFDHVFGVEQSGNTELLFGYPECQLIVFEDVSRL